VNGWLSLPLTLPRRVIDEGGSLVDAVLELPALLRSLGESLATMDEQVRGAASAVATSRMSFRECSGRSSRSTRDSKRSSRPSSRWRTRAEALRAIGLVHAAA